MLTTAEAAAHLGISQVGVRRHIERKRLASRLATPDELAALLTEGRIKSVPPSGVRLVDPADLEMFQRPTIGRPRKPPNIAP